MTFVCEIHNDERVLTLERGPIQTRTDQRQSFRSAQKLRWPGAQPEVLTPFLSKVALYGTGAIFLIGLAVAFFFAVEGGEGFPVVFLSQVRGPLVDKFVLGRDNLAILVFDVTIMAASICFLFVLPDLHWRGRRYLDTPVISPRRARKIRWGNYGGVAGFMIGLGGSFASRFAPAASGIRFLGPQDLASLGFAPSVSIIFVGPQELAFLGFAACAICYGMLGLAGTSFVPRPVAKRMVIAGVITSALVTIIVFVPIPPDIVTILHWGLFLGTVAWMVPFHQAYVKSWCDATPEHTELTGIDATIQETLWALGITSRQQLACEDSWELGAILGVPASRVDLWKGMISAAPALNPPRIAARTTGAVETSP